MKYLFLCFLFSTLSVYSYSCRTERKKSKEEGHLHNSDELFAAIFIDSLLIGDKGNNKLEIKRFAEIDSCYIDIFFYEKANNRWAEIQKYSFDTSILLPDLSNTIVEDYNNDGFGDFSYHSAIAARGANEVKKLFIYCPADKKLIYIKNSEDYPNLSYNKELDCIDAFAVYGGTTTYFLKIERDSLREFARIDLWDNQRIVSEIDNNGKETVLREDTINDGPYIRYANYKSLEEYTEN